MNWKLNRVAEVLAASSVVLSLLFVGFELQQNTNLTRANSYREITENLAENRSLIVSDPEISVIYEAYQNQKTSDLDERQLHRLSFLVGNQLTAYENAFFSRRYGIVGDSEWERLEGGVCVHFDRAINTSLWPRFLSAEFVQYLKNNC